ATATVATPGVGTLIGREACRGGGHVTGDHTLSPSGVASVTTTSLAIGSHVISASYAGDASFLTSTSGNSLTQVINGVATTTGTPTASANPAVYGQPVTYSVTVTSGSGTPAGTVTLLDGATRSEERRVGEGCGERR